MIQCKYEFKIGDDIKRFNSIEELYTFMDKSVVNEYSKMADVVYSLATKKEAQTNLLKNIRAEAKEAIQEKHKISLIQGEDTIFEGKNGELSISGFLNNSGEAVLNGKSVVTPYNEQDFRNSMRYQLISQHVSEEEANKQIDSLIKDWNITGELGKDLHKLIISKYIGSGNSSNEN